MGCWRRREGGRDDVSHTRFCRFGAGWCVSFVGMGLHFVLCEYLPTIRACMNMSERALKIYY